MIAHVDNRITYNGNGNATEFAYQFKILDRTDIKVLLTDADGKEKLLTKDYYVDVEKNVVRYPGYAVGAEVPESERPPVLPTGWKLTIYREVPVTQETDLPDQYPFNQVEDIGDKLTMICQQLTDAANRSLKVNVSKSSDVSTTIPWESGKSFRINDSGTGIELTEDPAKVLPLAQSKLEATTAQANIAAAKATAAAESESKAKSYAVDADASKTAAAVSSSDAANSAAVAAGYKADTLLMKNAVAENVKAAKESETNAKQASASASASESEAKAAKAAASDSASIASNSASAAKRYGSEANSYAEIAKASATTATTKASEATDEANRAKSEADRAKSISDNIGNPVSDVTESNGTVTVTKANGAQSTFMAFPQGENGALPIEKGGTGASSLEQARENLGIDKLGLPVGFEAFTTNPNIQAGWLPLLGGEYSRTAYADLWAWVQTQNGYLLEESAWQAKAAANSGNVPFYSKGNGTTTFRVPALKCWVKGANSISEVGGYLAAGLPNITGTLLGSGANSINNETYFTGAFVYTNAVLSKTYGAAEKNEKYNSSADFKASLSNSIYGSSDTVQPPSIVGLWVVKAYGTVTNVGSVDVSNIASGLTALETRFSTDITPIRLGGTGATSAAAARSNLGVDVDVLLADATLLWQNPNPTSSFSGDSLTLSQPYTNFKRLLFITSVASNGYTFVSAGFINVDVLSANIELVRNNKWTYVTYMVGTTGSGIYGDVSMITTTELQYSGRSGLRPQFIYGYK